MSSYSVDNFMNNLPFPIQKDEHLNQLAEVAARAFLALVPATEDPAIYSKIEELDEELLDILAEDLKVDWYDPNYNLEVKRRLIASNWYIHKRLGTPLAVTRLLSDIYPGSTVEEWYEYGGTPYHFRVWLTGTYQAGLEDWVAKLIRLAKPARAAFDMLLLKKELETQVYAGTLTGEHESQTLTGEVTGEADSYVNPRMAVIGVSEILSADEGNSGREEALDLYTAGGYAGSLIASHTSITLEVG